MRRIDVQNLGLNSDYGLGMVTHFSELLPGADMRGQAVCLWNTVHEDAPGVDGIVTVIPSAL